MNTVIEVMQMAVWVTDQIRMLVFPKSPANVAAADVLNLITKLYEGLDHVVYGLATPSQAKADCQKLIDAVVGYRAISDAAAEEKP